MTISWLDDCKFTAASGGTGDFVVSAAVSGYQTPASAGAVNGATYRYRAESADLTQWELGTGTYTSSGTTLARATVLFSTNSGSKVSFTNPPTVGITLIAEDASTFSAQSGVVNKFRNGTMDVWQRGTVVTVTTAGGYTADGWIVVPAGASIGVQQQTGRALTKYALVIVGASSVTDVVLKQRIEGAVAAPLTSQTVTVQAQIYNSTGNSLTPTLTVKHANATDNWSAATTDISAVNLQTMGSTAGWSQVAYTFTDAGSAANGLEISFDFGNNFGSGSQQISLAELDIRVTPGLATGINKSPPPPELRPVGVELPFCLRYYETSYNGVAAGTVTQVGQYVVVSNNTAPDCYTLFQAPKRVTPTVVVYSPISGASGKLYSNGAGGSTPGDYGASQAFGSPRSLDIYSSGLHAGDQIIAHYTASAEL